MSSHSQSLYDRQITIFSPDGKLFQIEYALRAVKGSNVTCLGLRGKNCVVLVAQKKVPTQNLHQDKLIDPSSITSLYHISDRIGGMFVGMPADCRAMVFRAREKASKYQATNGHRVPVQYLAMKIANINQMYTQHAYMRLHACVGLMAQIDEELGPQLYQFDPAGWYTGNKAAAAGVKDAECISALEKILKNEENRPEYELDTEEKTLVAAIGCLQSVVGFDFKSTDIEVGIVTEKNPGFRRLQESEIETCLNIVAEQD